MPRFLEKRRRRWYAVLDVPQDLRKTIGKKRLVKSLETDSLSVAEARVLAAIHQWKILFAEIREGRHNQAPYPTAWRFKIDELRQAKVPEHEIAEALGSIATEMDDTAMASLQVAKGEAVLLSEHVEGYLETALDAKTRDMKAMHLRKFLNEFKLAEDVNSEAVAAWIKRDLRSLSWKTVKLYLSTYRMFWKYLGKKKLVPKSLEAFTDAVEAPQRGNSNKRAYFTPENYKRLLEASQNDSNLNDLISLGAYTGARIEEICSLKVSDINTDKGFFTVTASKTEAGIRQIPIHPAIRQLVARLIETSKDGYLLSGLTNNKYGDRSNAIGKRFGRLKHSLGYGRELVFHSFRRGVATQFESAKVPEVLAARLLGHDFPTMSFGVYSGGADIETLREAIEVLRW